VLHESYGTRKFLPDGLVAQWIARRTSNPEVVGSSPIKVAQLCTSTKRCTSILGFVGPLNSGIISN
jgi:hypothetical protein